MKQVSKEIKLTMVALIAMMAIALLSYIPRVYADSYATTPQEVTFGETYSGAIEVLEKNRYDFVLKKAGTVTITGNIDQLDMTYGPNYYMASARIEIYDEAGKKLSQDWIGGSKGSQYFEITANLNKGKYYFTVDGSSAGGINYTLKSTYKEFPATSVQKLTNKATKKLKVTWTKKATVSGYQIQIATNAKFTKNKKTYTVTEVTTTNKTISKLKKTKKYYVRIRTYTTTLDGTKAYSKWSTAKKIKITK